MNNGAFETRVLPMKERIFRIARSMLCDVSEAEDATQDILEKLWLRRGGLHRLDSIEAYVFMVARNHCLDRIRRSRTRREAAATIHAEAVASEVHPAETEMRDMTSIARRLIAQLPEKQQAVMFLRDVEGCDFDEITTLTGMAEPTARVMLSRARKTIREQLIKLTNYGI